MCALPALLKLTTEPEPNRTVNRREWTERRGLDLDVLYTGGSHANIQKYKFADAVCCFVFGFAVERAQKSRKRSGSLHAPGEGHMCGEYL